MGTVTFRAVQVSVLITAYLGCCLSSLPVSFSFVAQKNAVRPLPPSIDISVPTSTTVTTTTTRAKTTSLNLFDFLKPQDESKESEEESSNSKEVDKDVTTSDDPVDKIFNVFFGKKEEAPMGMKRFGQGTG